MNLKRIPRLFSLILLITWQSFCFGQVIRETKARIENIDFFLVDDKVKITYDLVNGKDWEIFDIMVEIMNASDSSRVAAKTFSGDITAIKTGKGKIITWDIKADLPYLDQNIFIELTAVPTNPKMIPYHSKTKAILESTVFPGWGTAKLSLHNAHLVKGVVAYSLVGLSFKFNLDAVNSYDLYRSSTLAADRDRYYKQAENQYATSIYLGIGAASVWAIEYVWILATRNQTRAMPLQSTSLRMNMENGPLGPIPAITLSYKF